MMNDAEIRRYAGLMAELGLTGLEVTEKDQVIRLERSPAPAAARETVAVPAAPAAAAPQGAAPADTVEVASPMVGVFYAAPAEDAEPFVKVGDKVLTSKYSGTEVKVDGEECTIVRQADILAIVE